MSEGTFGYYVFWWLVVFVVVVGTIFAMCELDSSWHPDQTMKYAQECLSAHGSYAIQQTDNGTNRSGTLN
jgi:hypothetical protein